MIKLLILTFSLTFLVASSRGFEVVNLTQENYDEVTKEKAVFIRFFAPWCSHSKKMAPDWQRLAKEWNGHDVGLIAGVDCSGDAQPLCDNLGVYQFPFLKYGDPNKLETYDGSRTYDDLLAFSKANLKRACTATNLEACNDEQRTLVEEFQNASKEEIQKRIRKEQFKLVDHTKEFDKAVNKFTKGYEALVDAKDKKIEEIRSGDLKFLQTIQKAKAKGVAGATGEGKDEL